VLRVVFATVVFVRALIDPFSYCGRIVFEHFGSYRLFVSREILQEILEVLRRPELARKFRTLTGLDMTRVLQVVSAAELAEADALQVGSRDPDDDKFLGAVGAIDGDYLVSEDRDLLVLKQYASAKIVGCQEFIEILERGATS
jgi:putative PIN family toxin of toxin-antitoxin system